MKIAAIQFDAKFADVKYNLDRLNVYIEQAVTEGAKLILLPEFFSSAIGFSEEMLKVAIENRSTKNWMKENAKKYNVILGGSFISLENGNAYNLFNLVFPDGKTYEHKKDIPTQFENCYYTKGDENNVLETPIGNIGVALCWEQIRYDTLRRISGKADFVLAGSCWWDLPVDAPITREPLRKYNQKLALETPVTFAKLAGVPVVHAAHCGMVTAFNFPACDKIQTRQLVGAAQIIDENSTVLSRREFSEGGGTVIADVKWDSNKRAKQQSYPERYWIPDLPDSYMNAWETINPKGIEYYNTVAKPFYKKNH